MICNLWGQCGGCSLPLNYEEQLLHKKREFENLGFATELSLEIFESPRVGYRSRGEFRIFSNETGLHLAMFASKKLIIVSHCPILLPHLQEVLKHLMEYLNCHSDFAYKLFSVEIMGSSNQESLLTLVYHRYLDEEWMSEAKELADILRVRLIGRSRGQKAVVSDEGLLDLVVLDDHNYRFVRYDNSFSQPNSYMNIKMLEFAISCVEEDAQDLLELYCGGGNFTIPLSQKFKKVFATEVAKSSIKALTQNLQNNHIDNVFCARLSGEESIKALSFKREFNRLRGVDLKQYHFTHLLVDPPRSGIGDKEMLGFMQRFENIIYISCNPKTLKQDLEVLNQTHKIQRLALFDQFPYTHHLECGVWLKSSK